MLEVKIRKSVGYSLEDGQCALYTGLEYLKAISRRCLTVKSRIQFQAHFGVFGGHRGTETSYFANTLFSHVTVIPAMLHFHIHSSTFDAVLS
jgi:hypothetical protein